MQYIYSPTAEGFFPLAEKEIFEQLDLWPTDGVLIAEKEHDALFPLPENKLIGLVDNKACWVDMPSSTKEQLITVAEKQRLALLKNADEVTADWRTELMLDEINDEDKARLSAWMAYKREVKAVNISTAPDITWPVPPEV